MLKKSKQTQGKEKLTLLIRKGSHVSFNFEHAFHTSLYNNKQKVEDARLELQKERLLKSEQLKAGVQIYVKQLYNTIIGWSKNGSLFKTRHILNSKSINFQGVSIDINIPKLQCSTHNQVTIDLWLSDEVKTAETEHQTKYLKADCFGFLAFTDHLNVTLGFDVSWEPLTQKLELKVWDDLSATYSNANINEVGKLLIYLLTKIQLDKYKDNPTKERL